MGSGVEVVPSGVRVRRAQPGDLDSLLWHGEHMQANCREKLERHARGDSVVLVALVSGEVVGHLEIHARLLEEEGGVLLAWFEVKEESRGRGIGSALLAEAERVAVELDRVFAEIEVEKGNVVARLLYERLGYAVVGERLSSWWADMPEGGRQEVVSDDWVLRKSVAAGPE